MRTMHISKFVASALLVTGTSLALAQEARGDESKGEFSNLAAAGIAAPDAATTPGDAFQGPWEPQLKHRPGENPCFADEGAPGGCSLPRGGRPPQDPHQGESAGISVVGSDAATSASAQVIVVETTITVDAPLQQTSAAYPQQAESQSATRLPPSPFPATPLYMPSGASYTFNHSRPGTAVTFASTSLPTGGFIFTAASSMNPIAKGKRDGTASSTQGWPSDVDPSMTPAGAPPAAAQCTGTLDGRWHLAVDYISETADKAVSKYDDLTTRHAVFVTLNDGMLLDQDGRVGAIVANRQFQFDGPPQSGTIYVKGWSVCGSGLSLFLGANSTFWSCNSGGFANIYDDRVAEQCAPVHLALLEVEEDTVGTSTNGLITEAAKNSNDSNFRIGSHVFNSVVKRGDAEDGLVGDDPLQHKLNYILTTVTGVSPAMTISEPDSDGEPGTTMTIPAHTWTQTLHPATPKAQADLKKRLELVPIDASLFENDDLFKEEDDTLTSSAIQSSVASQTSNPSASVPVTIITITANTSYPSAPSMTPHLDLTNTTSTSNAVLVVTDEVTIKVPPPFTSSAGATYTTLLNPIATHLPQICNIQNGTVITTNCYKNYTLTAQGTSTGYVPMQNFTATGLSTYFTSPSMGTSKGRATKTSTKFVAATSSEEAGSSSTARLDGGAKMGPGGGAEMAARAAGALVCVFVGIAYFL